MSPFAAAFRSEPLPLVFNVSVTVSAPLVPPSTAVVVPDRVTVALSLSVTATAPRSEERRVGKECGAGSAADHYYGPSTNRSSVAVTVSVLVSPLTAPTPNDFVSELSADVVAVLLEFRRVVFRSEPLPLVFSVSVTVNAPLVPPSTAVLVPDRVTVALSLSVTATAP